MDSFDRSIDAWLLHAFMFTLDVQKTATELGKNELTLVREIANGEITLTRTLAELRATTPTTLPPEFFAAWPASESQLRHDERAIAARIIACLDYMESRKPSTS
jgi:hypothetical protein